MNATEKAIRDNFGGKNNAALREEIRAAVKSGRFAVQAVGRRIGLTCHGSRGLDNVLATMPVEPAQFSE